MQLKASTQENSFALQLTALQTLEITGISNVDMSRLLKQWKPVTIMDLLIPNMALLILFNFTAPWQNYSKLA